MSTSDSLARLHGYLDSLEVVRSRIARGPKRVKKKQKDVDQRAAEIEVAKANVTRLRKIASEKNGQLQSNEAKIETLKEKLNGAKTNQEFTILKEQIEADKMANSVLEDEILEAFDKIEVAEAAVKEAEAAHQEAIEEQEAIAKKVADELPGLQTKEAHLLEDVAEAEAIIPEKFKRDYKRMKETHGSEALSAVQNNACTNCFVNLAPQTRVDLKADQFVFCRSCQRILFLPPDEPA